MRKQAQLCVGGRAEQTHAVSGEFAPGRAAGRAAGRRASGERGERLDGAGALGPGRRRCESRKGHGRRQRLRGAHRGLERGDSTGDIGLSDPAAWLVRHPARVNQGHRIYDKSQSGVS